MRKLRRLSDEAAEVLGLFATHPTRSWFGLEIIKDTEIKSGSLYPILHRFEERKLVLGGWEDIDVAIAERRRPRRHYQLNPDMAEVVDELLAEWRAAQANQAPRRLRPATLGGLP